MFLTFKITSDLNPASFRVLQVLGLLTTISVFTNYLDGWFLGYPATDLLSGCGRVVCCAMSTIFCVCHDLKGLAKNCPHLYLAGIIEKKEYLYWGKWAKMYIIKNLETITLLNVSFSCSKVGWGQTACRPILPTGGSPYFLCPIGHVLLFFGSPELIHFCLDSKGQYSAPRVSENIMHVRASLNYHVPRLAVLCSFRHFHVCHTDLLNSFWFILQL